MSTWPALEELVPHRGAMLLLESVLAHDARETVCATTTTPSRLFRDVRGHVPAFVAVEWIAQAVAVHGGLLARARGAAPGVGFLVGARRIALHAERLADGVRYRVRARPVHATRGLFAFDGDVLDADDRAVIEARLHLHLPDPSTVADVAGAGRA